MTTSLNSCHIQMIQSLLLYCRSGFENECAQEITKQAQKFQISGYVQAKAQQGFILFSAHEPNDTKKLFEKIKFHDLIFSRQFLLCFAILKNLPQENRITPILTALSQAYSFHNMQIQEIHLEVPDTNEDKELLVFCKKFTSPLVTALKKEGFNFDKENDQALHFLFLNSQTSYIALSYKNNASAYFMGIPRLKFPIDAPSRSTLKLEEAFYNFLSPKEQSDSLRSGLTAVDLGACPGGWTYQFVRRHIFVTAIDNGAIDKKLISTGLVEHLKEDGFKYIPKKPVHWLVCDMVEQPIRITQLILRWAEQKLAQEFIFNLKLPMKKRYEEVSKCLNLISESLNAKEIRFRLRARQLYHDREEVTVYLMIQH